jgi:hypothetical protein
VLPVRYEPIYICYIEESRRFCGLVVRVPGYITEMYCASCEVRTIYICYIEESGLESREYGRGEPLR